MLHEYRTPFIYHYLLSHTACPFMFAHGCGSYCNVIISTILTGITQSPKTQHHIPLIYMMMCYFMHLVHQPLSLTLSHLTVWRFSWSCSNYSLQKQDYVPSISRFKSGFFPLFRSDDDCWFISFLFISVIFKTSRLSLFSQHSLSANLQMVIVIFSKIELSFIYNLQSLVYLQMVPDIYTWFNWEFIADIYW